MSEVSREMIGRRKEQLDGLERLWRILLTEYFAKHHEFPPLLTGEKTGDLNQAGTRVHEFVGARPEIRRAIENLDMVQDMVTETALKVLKELEEEKMKKKKS